MELKKSSFYPDCDLTDKSNFKRYYFIDRDSSVYERIFLNIINPSVRENIISKHYLRTLAIILSIEKLGVRIVSRDNPWDFKVELSTGKTFNIEITSISDSQKWFRKFKIEERFAGNSLKEKLPLHEIIRLNGLLPNNKISKEIDRLKRLNTPKDELIRNPFKNKGKHIFLSSGVFSEMLLENLLRESIEKKELKNHSEKENTVLIIDNRTLKYELDDYYKALKKLERFIASSSFKEIWFYTGYCSDIDGNNADFMLAPMKASSENERALSKLADNKSNRNGILKI